MRKKKMVECIGCKREFGNKGGLNSHKRFCKEWQKFGLAVHKNTIPLEERKKIEAACPLCGKSFPNVYSMSAHKGYCSGANDYHSRSQDAKDRMAWSRGKILKEHDEIFCISEKNRTGYVKNALYKFKLKEHMCENCKRTEWQEEKIIIELHHVNGNCLDNRLENLQFLCPNCHSLTHNWRGRNKS
jgi:RNA polymerase subunit RPABC4/transcription elongation factor Spt4